MEQRKYMQETWANSWHSEKRQPSIEYFWVKALIFQFTSAEKKGPTKEIEIIPIPNDWPQQEPSAFEPIPSSLILFEAS